VVKIPLKPYRFPHATQEERDVPGDDPYAQLRRSFDRIADRESGAPAPVGAAVFLATAGDDVPEALGLPLPWWEEMVQPGMAVLDVGCGMGRDLAAVATRVGSTGGLAGIDLSPGMIRAAAGFLPRDADLRVAIAEDLPFEDRAFDVVLSNCCLGLVRDRAAALRQMKRVLRLDGMLVIADAVMLGVLREDLMQALRGWGNAAGDAVAASALRAELEEAGFAIERWRLEPLSRPELLDAALADAGSTDGRDRARIARMADLLADRIGRVFATGRRCEPRARA